MALTRDTPKAPRDAIEIYAGAFLEYSEASANIEKNGTIVFHPRTGAPIENPYLRVRKAAEASMLRCRLRNVGALWGGPMKPGGVVRRSAQAGRRVRAVESYRTAAEAIGPVEPGLSVFAITRGQFSMVDAVMHVLEACAPARVSLWTWRIADYEVDVFRQLAEEGRIAAGTLIIDQRARSSEKGASGADLLGLWRSRFGAESVRYVVNHAKIATVEGNGLRVLLRGSMNLNFNPRFEQLDVTEGGPDFDLVREIEGELEVLPDDAPFADVARSSKVSSAFDAGTLALFAGVKRWAK